MITVIKYGTTKNLGDYNSERLDVEYALAETECPVEAFGKVKTFVDGALDGNLEAPKKEEKKPAKKKAAKKAAKKEEVKEEAPVKEEVKEEPKKEKKPAAKKAKTIPYNREEKTHKQTMAKLLNEVKPDWKDDKESAKNASVKLNGVEFMDNKGNVLDTFKEALKEELGLNEDL